MDTNYLKVGHVGCDLRPHAVTYMVRLEISPIKSDRFLWIILKLHYNRRLVIVTLFRVTFIAGDCYWRCPRLSVVAGGDN